MLANGRWAVPVPPAAALPGDPGTAATYTAATAGAGAALAAAAGIRAGASNPSTAMAEARLRGPLSSDIVVPIGGTGRFRRGDPRLVRKNSKDLLAERTVARPAAASHRSPRASGDRTVRQR